MIIKIKKIGTDSKLPQKQHEGDAGYDCFIHGFKVIIERNDNDAKVNYLIDYVELDEFILKPLRRVVCGLGFATEIPKGYYAQIVPRSGLAVWNGLTILNTPATIDSGFRNEWMATIINISNKDVKLKVGERICQIIIKKLVDFEFEEVEELNESERGLDGIGSTGR